MRKTNINEIYVKILQNFYNQIKARIHLDKSVSDEFPINRGVRQGDPLSPKLFTAVMEGSRVFKKAHISEGINVDGEDLTNFRFAGNVALFNEKHVDGEDLTNFRFADDVALFNEKQNKEKNPNI